MRVQNVKHEIAAVTSINNVCDEGGGTVAKAYVTDSGTIIYFHTPFSSRFTKRE